jgi:hypothetical protein
MTGETGRIGKGRAIMVPQTSQEWSSPPQGEDRRFKSGRDYITGERFLLKSSAAGINR